MTSTSDPVDLEHQVELEHQVDPAGPDGANGPADPDGANGPNGPLVRLECWAGQWADDDPHANLKHDIALYGRLDPLTTLQGLSATVDIPVGALARYVLTRWATAGSGGLLEVGPQMVERLWAPVAGAEETGTDEARLSAYDVARQMLSWLRVPLSDPSVYPAQER